MVVEVLAAVVDLAVVLAVVVTLAAEARAVVGNPSPIRVIGG